MERKDFEEQLTALRGKNAASEQAQLDFLKQNRALQVENRNIDLEVTQKVDELRAEDSKNYDRQLHEKDQLIADLTKKHADAVRLAEQGPQHRQGEAFQKYIQTDLERYFPDDIIKLIDKGVRGADHIHEVREQATMRNCGKLVYEDKDVRNWNPESPLSG